MSTTTPYPSAPVLTASDRAADTVGEQEAQDYEARIAALASAARVVEDGPTKAELATVVYEEHGSTKRAAAALGIPHSTFRGRLKSTRRPVRRRTPEELRAARCEMVAEVCSLAGSTEYTAGDVARWLDRAVEADCVEPNLGPQTILDLFQLRIVPNAPFRARYRELERRGALDPTVRAPSLSRIAVALGRNPEDTSYAQRALGMTPSQNGEGRKRTLSLFLTYEQAATLADVLDLDPHAAGI